MKTLVVLELPNCSYCELNDTLTKARFDARNHDGGMAFMCERCFAVNGVGNATLLVSKYDPTKQGENV